MAFKKFKKNKTIEQDSIETVVNDQDAKSVDKEVQGTSPADNTPKECDTETTEVSVDEVATATTIDVVDDTVQVTEDNLNQKDSETETDSANENQGEVEVANQPETELQKEENVPVNSEEEQNNEVETVEEVVEEIENVTEELEGQKDETESEETEEQENNEESNESVDEDGTLNERFGVNEIKPDRKIKLEELVDNPDVLIYCATTDERKSLVYNVMKKFDNVKLGTEGREEYSPFFEIKTYAKPDDGKKKKKKKEEAEEVGGYIVDAVQYFAGMQIINFADISVD